MYQSVGQSAIDASGQNYYQHPTPQLVYIRQQRPFIQISLPLLQQYYINVSKQNQDYAFFQVVYYDFPLYDIPSNVLGLTQTVKVLIEITYKDSNGQLVSDATSQLQMTLYLEGIRSIDEMANEIKRSLAFEINKKVVGDAYAAQNSLLQAASLIKDFYFDSSSQKYVMSFAPSSNERSNQIQVGANLYNEIQSIRVQFYQDVAAGLTYRQAKYMAMLFGAELPAQGETFWSLVYTTNQDFYNTTLAFQAQAQLFYKEFQAAVAYKQPFKSYNAINSYSKTTPRLVIDEYIYIRGSPDSSIWNNDGTSSDIAVILPRNRQVNSTVTADQAFLTQSTHIIKSSLNSMRLMNLTLTDSEGNPLEFDQDFVLQFAIIFNID